MLYNLLFANDGTPLQSDDINYRWKFLSICIKKQLDFDTTMLISSYFEFKKILENHVHLATRID